MSVLPGHPVVGKTPIVRRCKFAYDLSLAVYSFSESIAQSRLLWSQWTVILRRPKTLILSSTRPMASIYRGFPQFWKQLWQPVL